MHFHRLIFVIPVLLAAAGAGACAPMAGAIPVATMQRATTLPAGGSAVSAGAGVGVSGLGWPEGALGGSLQQRVARADGSEWQFTGQMIANECSGCEEPRRDTHVSMLGRLGGKWRLGDDSALVAGGSYAGHAGGTSVGADLGVILDLSERWYGSLRAGGAAPISQDDADFAMDERVPLTGWASGALGIHGLGDAAFFAETGLGLITGGDETSLGVYVIAGIDVLKLAE